MTTESTPNLKHCPGVESLGLAPHELPATGEHFSTNKSLRDGLAVRCRGCDGAYGKAWTIAKKAGDKFSAKGPLPASVAAQWSQARSSAPAVAAEPSTVVVGGLKPAPVYHDELAVRAARGRAKGYTAETVGGVVYALPDSAASTPEGQAALAAVNEARAAERRRRDAERKRAERAAKKAKEGAIA